MAKQLMLLSPIAACALLLTGCKPDLDPKLIEAQTANTEAQCACVGKPEYDACLERANTEHPKAKPEDGFKEKYSDASVKAFHQQIVLAGECSKAAMLTAPPE
jgi:hypothetical protein